MLDRTVQEVSNRLALTHPPLLPFSEWRPEVLADRLTITLDDAQFLLGRLAAIGRLMCTSGCCYMTEDIRAIIEGEA